MPPEQRKIEAQRKIASMKEALGKLVGDQEAEDRGRVARKAIEKPTTPPTDAKAAKSS